MELRWPAVALAGLGLLLVCVAVAVLLPIAKRRRKLRPLAHVDRLTRLPEYVRAARMRTLSTAVAIALLALLFVAVLLAGARPTEPDPNLAETHPEDIMLCVGAPVDDPATGELLSYFAAQATTYGTERIGLTSQTRRVVPMTRDHQYAAGRFGDYARTPTAPPASFAPAVSYVDYAQSVADVLALCMTGFPSFEEPSTHRRSLIYLGPSEFRRDGEQLPALFTDERIQEMADRAGIQINVIIPIGADQDADAALRAVTDSTGGRFVSYRPADPGLPAALDGIRADPPLPSMPGDSAGLSSENPTIPLGLALVAAALLTVSVAVLRR